MVSTRYKVEDLYLVHMRVIVPGTILALGVWYKSRIRSRAPSCSSVTPSLLSLHINPRSEHLNPDFRHLEQNVTKR